MSTEPPRRDSLRPLRPLPSVALPLLRTERSALRTRRIVLASIAGLAAVLLGGGLVLAYHVYAPKPQATAIEEPVAPPADLRDVAPNAPAALAPPEPAPDADPDAPPLQAAAEDVPPPRAAGRYERPLGRARSFDHALRKAGLDVSEAEGVTLALTKHVDFRHVHPEDVLIVERGPTGDLSRLEYRASATSRYEAVRTDTGFEGRPIQLQIESVRIARGGIVEGSLGDALEGLKVGRTLTGLFADVFSGKVNFSTDTRTGDSFRVLLEEERVEGKFLRHGTVYALEYKGERTGLVRAFWHESKRTEGDFFDEQGRALHGGWLRTPLRYDHVSSGYGMRLHPVLKRKLLHNGIDYSASIGTAVRAAAAGTVKMAGSYGPNGNLLALAHPHGYETFYAHLSRFAPGIKPGVRVKQRQLIGYVGSTGRSTGPHLHFTLKKAGRVIDPNSQLNGPGLPLPANELSDYKRRVHELCEQLASIPLERPDPVTPPPVQPESLELGEEEL